MKAFLDTHALVYLFDGQIQRFGIKSRKLLETADLFYSPAARLELAFLSQIGRLACSADDLLGRLAIEAGLVESQDYFGAIVKHAMNLPWTRDPFDLLIVANALLHGSPLLTRDRRIQANCKAAIW